MKISKLILAIAFGTVSLGINAQDLIFSKDGELHTYNSSHQVEKKYSESGKVEFSRTKTYSIDLVTSKEKDIDTHFSVSNEFDLIKGVQNPNNENQWIYLERQQIGGNFGLYEYNKITHQKRAIHVSNDNDDRRTMAFIPIGWSSERDVLFVEGFYIDSAEEHEGIWKLNILNNKLKKVDFSKRYYATPVLSPNRETIYVVSNVDNSNQLLHVEANEIIAVDSKLNTSKSIVRAKGQNIIINGFEGDHLMKDSGLVTEATSFSNLDYYLPWDAGLILGTTRDGTPGSTGPHTYESYNAAYDLGAHSYPAVDFATSTTSDQNVRAAQAGVVAFSGISTSLTAGYGRLVTIRHSDGTRTLYAHNKTLLVSQGATVTRGQIIALEGTTGGSTGDHIHFEWRAAGGEASSLGSFTGIGMPRRGYFYKSNNSTVINNTPTTTSPANNATGVLRPVNVTWTTPVNATSFRLQVSKSNTGWTDSNGFTLASSPSSTVVVNASLNNVLNFFWQDDAAAGTFEGPKPNTTYYYTVRSFDATTGTSKYSSVKTFKTDEGVNLTSPAFGATVNAPVALAWTSSIGTSGSYRLQIAKSSTGWTAANGFTSGTTTTTNVVVNHSASGMLSYSWAGGSAGSSSAPAAGTTYYWTVRLFNPANNYTSSYSPVRAFKVSSVAARIFSESSFNDASLVVYPNPSREIINIGIKNNNELTVVEIIDFNGTVLKTIKTKEQDSSLEVHDVQEGLYILRVSNSKGTKTTNVFVTK
jgi:hypothetical protein